MRFQEHSEIPEWVWGRTELEFLSVSDNQLTALSPGIARPTMTRLEARGCVVLR
jgi:hypothetical protein